MNEKNKKEIVKSMMNVEFSPCADITEYVSSSKGVMKFPLSEIANLGIAFASIPESMRTITSTTNQAVEGLYRCRFPDGVSGRLAQKGTESLGTIVKDGGGLAQARWSPVDTISTTTTTVMPFNPTMLFMAAALMNIEKKLESIEEIQQEIIEIIEEEKKAKLKSDLDFLSEIMNNYKYNWENENYKNTRHIKVLDIKQTSEQSIIFYREQIKDLLDKLKKKQFFIDSKDVKSKLKKMQYKFSNYQKAIYLYCFASYLDVMLLENFSEDYLNSIVDLMGKHSFKYRELYTDCYNLAESQLGSSIQAHLLNGVSGINKVAGKKVANTPIIKESSLDEKLLAAGSKLDSLGSENTKKAMEPLESNKDNYVNTFIDSITTVRDLYNQPMEVYIDNENIYYLEYNNKNLI